MACDYRLSNQLEHIEHGPTRCLGASETRARRGLVVLRENTRVDEQSGRALKNELHGYIRCATTGQQLLYALDEQVRRWEVAGRVRKFEFWEYLGMVRDENGDCAKPCM